MFHQVGHTLGSALTIALCSLAAWYALGHHVTWVGSWALGGTVAASIGGVLWIAIVRLDRGAASEVVIALALFLPLGAAAIGQARAVRNRVDRATAWAALWAVGVLTGVAVQWYGSGGVDGIAVRTVHPVLQAATAYFWDTLPTGTLGALAYAVMTAIALPIDSPRNNDASA